MRNQKRALVPDPELRRILNSVLSGDILTFTVENAARSKTTAVSGPAIASHGIVGIDMYDGSPLMICDYAGTVPVSISSIEVIGGEKWSK